MNRAPDTIVIAGGLAQRPHYAGHSWQFLHYLLGLKDLGWEVLFLDRLEPAMCVDASGTQTNVQESIAWRYFRRVMEQFGLAQSYCVLFDEGRECLGLSRTEVIERTRRSAFLLNVMGFLTDEEILAAAPRRVFLDTDPGIGQIWRELGLHDLFRGHDDFVTIGERIGKPDCEIPDGGLKWITMRQPVLLSLWPARTDRASGHISSIVSWRGPFGPLEFRGKQYGLRVHEFRKFCELPTQTDLAFDLALDIDPADTKDVGLLSQNQWSLLNPHQVAGDPTSYQHFLQNSLAEFMVAKNIYVQTRGGWFSDRSTCYLASGRPVIAQDTGLQDLYPVGRGLLTFTTPAEALESIKRVDADYSRHAQAVRNIAEEFFDSRRVFSRLLSQLQIS